MRSSPSVSAWRFTACEPGTTQAVTPGATLRPFARLAAVRKSDRRALAQEPMNTLSTLTPAIRRPASRPMYASAFSRLSRVTRSTNVAGSAIVKDAPLTFPTQTTLIGNTGVPIPAGTVIGTFTDGNTFATTADFKASIDWGDGSPNSTGTVVATATPGLFYVEGGHTYAKASPPGSYTINITVDDDGGSSVVVPVPAVITDLAVTQVLRGSPAQRAGIAPGDLITGFAGESVASDTALTDLLDQQHPGNDVPLTWVDPYGQQSSAVVTLAPGPVG